MSWLLVVFGLIMFVGLVVIHEWGHFIMARRNGVEVEEFGIGFPPRAKSLGVKNGTEYTLNWLPLGGFVKLKGEHDADTEPGTFGAASLPAKIKIMLAGVVMNIVTAFLLLTILAFVGMPRILENQFTVASDTDIVRRDVVAAFIEEGSPADNAGLQSQDILSSIGLSGGAQRAVNEIETFPDITRQFAGQEVDIEYRRSGKLQTTSTTLRTEAEVTESQDTDSPKGYLGIVPNEYVVQRSTWSSPVVALGFMKQITTETFKGLGTAIGALFQGDTARASAQVSGVVGIGFILTQGSLLGIQFVLLIIAIISLTLAIMNVLPIPALDGGRLFVTLLYRAIRRPLTPKTEEWIHGSGFIALMLLFVLITIVDVNRFF